MYGPQGDSDDYRFNDVDGSLSRLAGELQGVVTEDRALLVRHLIELGELGDLGGRSLHVARGVLAALTHGHGVVEILGARHQEFGDRERAQRGVGLGIVSSGDRVVLTAGTAVNIPGSTNVIKVEIA